MSTKDNDVRVVVSADVSGLKPGMDEARRHIRDTSLEVDKAGGSMLRASSASDTLSGSLKGSAASALRHQGMLGRVAAGLVHLAPLAGTVSVAALGAFAVAAFKGAKESERLEKSLILTGYAAGITSSALSASAQAVAAETGLIRNKVASASMAMIEAGNVSAEVIGKAAESAVLLQRFGGKAVEQTAKAFASLGDEPLKASIALNKNTNYLTVSLLEQIKAFEDQGRVTDAARLAQEAYADSTIARMKSVDENLGMLERGWRLVRDTAGQAWDSMMNAGRKSSLLDQIQEIEGQLANTRAGKGWLSGGLGFGGESEARSKLAVLRSQLAAQEGQAIAAAEQAKQTKAWSEWTAEGDKYLSRTEARLKEIAKVRRLAAEAGIVDEAEIARRIAAVEQKYRAKISASPSSGWRDDQDRLMQRNLAAEMAARKREAEQVIQANAVMQESVDGLGRAYERRNQIAAESMLGDSERQLAEALRTVTERADQARESLAQKAAAMEGNAVVQAEYVRRLAEVSAGEQAQIAIERANHSARMRMQQDWRVGADRALTSYQNRARDVAAASEQAFTRAFSGMEDALVEFAMTGKLNFSNLANSIISDIIRIQVRAAMTQAMGGGSSGLGNLLGGLFGNVGTAFKYDTRIGSQQTSMLAAQDAVFNAKGNVYDSPSLSAYSGGVYDQPKTFAFAKGAGIFAEAGPEAIMPLQRDSRGRLGVSAAGGGMSLESVRVEIRNEGTPQEVTRAQPRFDAEGMVVEILTRDIANEGPVSKSMQSRFGLSRAAGAYA